MILHIVSHQKDVRQSRETCEHSKGWTESNGLILICFVFLILCFVLGHTEKSLGCALTGRWICRPNWMKANGWAGVFVDEETNPHCTRYESRPFKSKAFVLTKEFLASKKKDRVDLGQKLIQIGGGHILEFTDANLARADFILCANPAIDGMGLPTATDWEQFMVMIPGTRHQDKKNS